MKSFTIILVIVIVGVGIYIGFQHIPTNETETANTNEAEIINTNQIENINTVVLVNTQVALNVPTGDQMNQSAREYVTNNSVEGLEFELDMIRELDKWALLSVIPLDAETDVAMIIMEKVDDVWIARDFGTSLPEWEEKVPELF